MLLTKLHIPFSGTNLVQRPTLFNKLNEGLKRKLILISAPAGFGKSIVVSDWINQYKIPAAWFSIDNNDNDPVDFLCYVILAIQSIKKEFGQSAFKLLKSPNPPSSKSIIDLLINEIIDINKNFLLVIDDFHVISNNEIYDIVSYILEHIPDNTHLVILSRSDPSLPIAKLRSQNQLVELRSSDLSFTVNDISILFNKKYKFKLSVKDIHSLEAKTEGWIAGLQLAALSMQGREDISEFIETLKGDNRYIMDYLIEEVLKVQSDDITEFLIQTSILEQISAPLCNAVLNRNDSQLILEKLEKHNMFVFPLDTKRHWYRYHHLFADLLKQKLLQKDKLFIEELHKRACEWFEQNNMHDQAIEHALKINNYERSSQILNEVVENMWEKGQHAAIMKYGDILPDDLIKKFPEFCLYYSWILIAAGKIKKAEIFLKSAEKTTTKTLNNTNSSKENTKYYKKLLGKISVAFAYLNSHEEHSEKTFDYCKTAMENLSEDDPFWYSWVWFSYGVSYFSIGDLHKSIEAFNNAFDYGKKSGNIYLISTIAIRMAENEQQLGYYKSAYKKCSDLLDLLKERGYEQITKTEWTYAALYFIMGVTQFIWADFERAFKNIKIAYNLSKGSKDIYLKGFILMVYSIILKEIGDVDAEKRMKELEDMMEKNDVPPFLTSLFIGWKVYLLMEKNQIVEASNVFKQYGLELDKEKNHINEAAYSSYARLLLAQGKLDEAELLITELYLLVSKEKWIERMIFIKILYTTLYKMKGKQDEAVIYLMEAMELASEENLVLSFVYNLSDINDLLEEVFKIHATTKTKIPQKFIDNLKVALEKRKKLARKQVDSELSIRELDTLKLIAEDLSNQEIADKLFISINTVKSHVKNILLKLEVDSRSKAVSKAKNNSII